MKATLSIPLGYTMIQALGLGAQEVSHCYQEFESFQRINSASAYASSENASEIYLMVVIGNRDDNTVGNLEWSIHLQNLGMERELIVIPGSGHGIRGVSKIPIQGFIISSKTA